jgi:hypothetical protein
VLVGTIAASLAFLAPATAALAAPTPTPTAGASGGASAEDKNKGPATPGEAVCTTPSGALNEVSGMVATSKALYVVQGGNVVQPSTVKIYTVNASNCKVTSKTYSTDPVDPEDLAVDSKGNLWVADIGDNSGGSPSRLRVAFEKVSPNGTSATVYRVVYPNNGKFDAGAMLLDKDDVPIILTRSGGKAGIYRPTKALVPNSTTNLTPLEKVGDFVPQKTGTSNPLGVVGSALVTGAAKSPDGKKVVIRTRSDAYEFTVGDDGDIVKAITSTDPVVTPLPDEPQGEAITYSADGSKFLTLSAKSADSNESPKLLSYTPFVPVTDNPNATGDPGENLPAQPGGGQNWLDQLTFSELTRIVAAVGVVGLVLAIAGIVGIRRARRRRREEDEYDDYDDDYDDAPRRRGRGRDDDRGYAPRDPQYAEYGQYGDGYGGGYSSGGGYGASGYAESGYGSNGYAAAGYGHAQAAEPTGNGYAGAYGGQQPGYPSQGYGDAASSYGQYGADQYAAQQPQQQPQQPQPQQQYAGYDPYGQPQYGGQYGGDQNYGTGGYGAQGYAGQQYGGDGYGYEEDFDPLHDPRRR